ncbi:uncharacterized protein ASCRUDRAFT_74099 [Ascoidea rubescens DSM 1968]|uniref:DRBM domain-containing protein n=1 Tax=Ascoidea rubescens DSM 1968 TaxID=1344418 RepID=A0A1D2VSD2_9ASCO|nr:hypothetical protein ASCRUDRAFT_74099 [Ascoidea rubescens DSM 1968]ODV64488.1 hypothetical protein ASCRUDRAFT_74099 [Ascoidea rubescens DSM 1968]
MDKFPFIQIKDVKLIIKAINSLSKSISILVNSCIDKDDYRKQLRALSNLQADSVKNGTYFETEKQDLLKLLSTPQMKLACQLASHYKESKLVIFKQIIEYPLNIAKDDLADLDRYYSNDIPNTDYNKNERNTVLNPMNIIFENPLKSMLPLNFENLPNNTFFNPDLVLPLIFQSKFNHLKKFASLEYNKSVENNFRLINLGKSFYKYSLFYFLNHKINDLSIEKIFSIYFSMFDVRFISNFFFYFQIDKKLISYLSTQNLTDITIKNVEEILSSNFLSYFDILNLFSNFFFSSLGASIYLENNFNFAYEIVQTLFIIYRDSFKNNFEQDPKNSFKNNLRFEFNDEFLIDDNNRKHFSFENLENNEIYNEVPNLKIELSKYDQFKKTFNHPDAYDIFELRKSIKSIDNCAFLFQQQSGSFYKVRLTPLGYFVSVGYGTSIEEAEYYCTKNCLKNLKKLEQIIENSHQNTLYTNQIIKLICSLKEKYNILDNFDTNDIEMENKTEKDKASGYNSDYNAGQEEFKKETHHDQSSNSPEQNYQQTFSSASSSSNLNPGFNSNANILNIDWDAKNKLYGKLGKVKLIPIYRFDLVSGRSRARIYVRNNLLGEGVGQNKKHSAQIAAMNALKNTDILNNLRNEDLD